MIGSQEEKKFKPKSFTYRTSAAWLEGRSGLLSSEGKPTLRVSSPPEFKGEQGVWTPEDLFVAAVEKADVPVTSYRSHANGVLEYVEGDFCFTRIVIFPTIVIAAEEFEDEVQELLRETAKHCLVTNSIASIVEINPTIMVQ